MSWRVRQACLVDEDEAPPSARERDARFEALLQEVARAPHYEPVQAGSQVGEYRVVRQLGKGSHGTVYEAVHVIIDKAAALKVLNPEFSGDPLIVQRFVDEARAVNRIKHPNIVDIFGFGELPDRRKYCAMALLEGQTLAQRLQSVPGGRLQADEALYILHEVASALDAAHESGVVHRDLKPQNIFLSRSEDGKSHITLLDFGLARMANDDRRLRTGHGILLGTPAYMSPEQCAGIEVDRSTDIYSLGIVAFELLTGRPPFVGTRPAHLLTQHLGATPPKPSETAPDLPTQIDDVFARWLAKKPGDRPASASASVHALATSLAQRAPTKRRWAGIALVVLAAIATAIWWRH